MKRKMVDLAICQIVISAGPGNYVKVRAEGSNNRTMFIFRPDLSPVEPNLGIVLDYDAHGGQNQGLKLGYKHKSGEWKLSEPFISEPGEYKLVCSGSANFIDAKYSALHLLFKTLNLGIQPNNYGIVLLGTEGYVNLQTKGYGVEDPNPDHIEYLSGWCHSIN